MNGQKSVAEHADKPDDDTGNGEGNEARLGVEIVDERRGDDEPRPRGEEGRHSELDLAPRRHLVTQAGHDEKDHGHETGRHHGCGVLDVGVGCHGEGQATDEPDQTRDRPQTEPLPLDRHRREHHERSDKGGARVHERRLPLTDHEPSDHAGEQRDDAHPFRANESGDPDTDETGNEGEGEGNIGIGLIEEQVRREDHEQGRDTTRAQSVCPCPPSRLESNAQPDQAECQDQRTGELQQGSDPSPLDRRADAEPNSKHHQADTTPLEHHFGIDLDGWASIDRRTVSNDWRSRGRRRLRSDGRWRWGRGALFGQPGDCRFNRSDSGFEGLDPLAGVAHRDSSCVHRAMSGAAANRVRGPRLGCEAGAEVKHSRVGRASE